MKGEYPPLACNGGHTAIDCLWGEWSSAQCSRVCGGGTQVLSRDILIEAQWGGKACEGPSKQMQACNTQECGSGRDCMYKEWQEWGACNHCGGQRKRFRHISMPSYDGKPCTQANTEEVQNCSRRCHGNHYCVWDTWSLWSSCSVTCGTGRQNRKRNLVLSEHQPHVPLEDYKYVMQKFEALQLDMQRRSQSHNQALVLCFLGGLVCFFAAGATFRFFVARRTSIAYSSLVEEESEYL